LELKEEHLVLDLLTRDTEIRNFEYRNSKQIQMIKTRIQEWKITGFGPVLNFDLSRKKLKISFFRHPGEGRDPGF